ncbi:hypothetical protein [Flavobacterium branchiophilum]|uniref:Uncharacterized protein n=1 Tax=Flavobacterium branchiophilum TaxID=55197 RepID=A0A543G065_9FLAO|nr:hypothetical protein [Flavobacterium branchiophilum]TQM39472.1 hypothetical protein BC670_0270 [Flavobacterium branchiophilum]
MRNVLFLILTFAVSWLSYSQEIVNEEYEIYGTLIGEQGYQFFPINFGIPTKFKFEIKDSIYTKIEKMDVKSIDRKKLIDVSLKYSINKTFKIIESDQYNQIYLSPIYFKSKDEAYFLYIIKGNLPKPYSYFYEAKRVKDKWKLTDYYLIN